MNVKDSDSPHFHAIYNEFEATIDIENFGVINGYLPPKVLSLVVEWSGGHKK
ncbi:MAG: hypothetical protein ACJAZX_000253 [Rickettsiales bacterium]|jgi:hypothetical protein